MHSQEYEQSTGGCKVTLGERLELLDGFNQEKREWGMSGIFRCSKRVKQMGHSGINQGGLMGSI